MILLLKLGDAGACRRQFFGVTIGTPVAIEPKYQLRAYVGGLQPRLYGAPIRSSV